MAKLLPSGARLEQFEQLDSTSSEARRRAEAGEISDPVWILALEQTSGYGRRGRSWSQGVGDIAATYVAPIAEPPAAAAQMSFLTVLALVAAVGRFAPKAPLALKWPNDVLLDGGKLAGILLEYIEGARGPAIAIGVGVNVVSKPEGLAYRTARLADWVDRPPSPPDFVTELDSRLDAEIRRWRAEGFGPARADWLERAAGLGSEIIVRTPAESFGGVFCDLDETGALILDYDGARRRVSAGDVFFSDKEARDASRH